MRTSSWTATLLTLALVAACSHGGFSATTSTAPSATITAVALGDSFSSGEGAPPYDATPKGCKRSDEGWVRRLHRDVAAIRSLDQRACSGATSADLVGSSADGGRSAQIPSTPDPSVTLVTLTIGGNDVGFGGIVAFCFVLDCSGEPTSAGYLGALNALTAGLDTTVYPAIARAYPNAHIVHVGYPRLTPASGQPVVGCAWLTSDEQPATARIVAELDDAIRTAAERAHVTYVDTTDAFTGHELCSGSSWVNPVSLTGQSQAHPAAQGQQALERSIAQALHLTLKT